MFDLQTANYTEITLSYRIITRIIWGPPTVYFMTHTVYHVPANSYLLSWQARDIEPILA